MTREERINSALLPILEKMREHRATDEMCKMYDNGFHVGAMWAYAHPHWISVEDKFPPMRDEDGMSDKVLTHSKGGGIYINRYDYEHNTWGNPIAFNVTHWMPLPQAPKGDAK